MRFESCDEDAVFQDWTPMADRAFDRDFLVAFTVTAIGSVGFGVARLRRRAGRKIRVTSFDANLR